MGCQPSERGVEADHAVASLREAQGEGQPHVAAADDADAETRPLEEFRCSMGSHLVWTPLCGPFESSASEMR